MRRIGRDSCDVFDGSRQMIPTSTRRPRSFEGWNVHRLSSVSHHRVGTYTGVQKDNVMPCRADRPAQ